MRNQCKSNSWLLRRAKAVLSPPQGQHERGATAIIAAALLVAMLGMGAYVIDIGAIFEERRDLQNGADAAALGLAIDCVVSGICTPGGGQADADSIASLNSNDGQATVNEADITFDMGSQTVTVTVHTQDALDGDGEINHTFAQVLGETSQAVKATASASWAAPGGGFTIPMIFSLCEWEEATLNGTVFGVHRIIKLHDPGVPSTCSAVAGQDIDGDGDRAEGGFGYLDSGDCSATLLVDDSVLGRPGAPHPGVLGCQASDLLDKELLIPIFDDIYATGASCSAPPGQNCYHVYGFAAFHVDEIDLANTLGWRNVPVSICHPSESCIGGRFIRFVSLEEAATYTGPTPPDLGVSSVNISG